MLRLMLNAHPAIAIPPETGFLVDVADRIEAARTADLTAAALMDLIAAHPLAAKSGLLTDEGRRAAMLEADFPSMVARLYEAYAHQHGKHVWGDKTPSYTDRIDVISRLFPAARFIHLVRDGRDVALSHKHIRWGTPDVGRVAVRWNFTTMVADKIGQMLGPSRYMRVRYDDLVRAPETALAAITRFLDLPFDPAMLHHAECAAGALPADSLAWHQNSVRPADCSHIDRWRAELSKAEIAIFEENAAPALRRFGFPLIAQKPSFALRLSKAAYFAMLRMHPPGRPAAVRAQAVPLTAA